MIAEAEIRRRAGAWSVDPMVADLDYVLGCFLGGLYGHWPGSVGTRSLATSLTLANSSLVVRRM